MNDIRILIVDDEPVVRNGLVYAINQQPGMKVVGEAKSSSEAVEKATEYLPDIVIMDLELPDTSGAVAISQILENRPDVRVLVLSAYNDDELVFQTIAAGAMGYVLKGSSMEEIVESIRAVQAGREVISPGIARTLVRGAFNRSRADPGPDEVLSKRELEVLKLTSDGSTLQEVGEMLGLSHNTIKTYYQRIMGKLDLHSKNELFKYAVRNKLIEVD